MTDESASAGRNERSKEALEREAAIRRAAQSSGKPRGLARSSDADSMLQEAANTPGLEEVGITFRALADNVRDYAVLLLNPDGVIIYWGEGARRMKWWTREQAEGSHLRFLYPEGGAEDGTAEDHIRIAMEKGEFVGEGHRIRSDLSTFWAGVTLTALKKPDGTLIGFTKVARDLTARRAAEAVLHAAHQDAENARMEAEAANRAKSIFLATMSHEFRTPLNAILGYLELLELDVSGTLTTEQRDFLARARNSGRHLNRLVDDVLDLARLEASRLRVSRAPGRIGDVLESAISLIEPEANTKSIKIRNSTSPTAAEGAYLGDEERTRQILLNLLSNAVKFTDPGGQITVGAGTAEEPAPEALIKGSGPWAYVRVEDTGQGISPDRLDAIFEPFVQADMSRTRQHGGTGLGLAISRQLARLMKGDLTVHSEPGDGSAFTLWLHAAPEGMLRKPDFGADDHLGVARNQFDNLGAPAHPGILRKVADSTLAEMSRILHAYVARLRSDPEMVHARDLSEEDLENHLATFLADVAQSLTTLELSGSEPSASLEDGARIQRAIAERHGRQRSRLNWTEAELEREFTVLEEEIASAIRRRMSGPENIDADRALLVLHEILANARKASTASYRRARADGGRMRPE